MVRDGFWLCTATGLGEQEDPAFWWVPAWGWQQCPWRDLLSLGGVAGRRCQPCESSVASGGYNQLGQLGQLPDWWGSSSAPRSPHGSPGAKDTVPGPFYHVPSCRGNTQITTQVCEAGRNEPFWGRTGALTGSAPSCQGMQCSLGCWLCGPGARGEDRRATEL